MSKSAQFRALLEIFMREGSTNAIADRLPFFEEFDNFVGLRVAVDRERRFAS